MEPMTVAMVVGSLLQAGSALNASNQQVQALKDQANYRAMVLATNRKIAQFQAAEAIEAGDKEANRIRKIRDKVLGAQKVSLAAQGLDITSGTALDLQNETEMFSELDIQTAKNNAWKEAWGIKVKAEQMGIEGRIADMATQSQIKSTYATGGLQALGFGLQAANYAKKG